MTQLKSFKTLQKAAKEATNNNITKSISLCKKAISQLSTNSHAYKLLATNLIKMQRYDEAGVALKKTITLVSELESDELQHLLGCNMISQRDYRSALSILEVLFNRNGDSKILLDIALAYFHLGDYQSSRDIYLKLIELEPNNHQAKFNLYPILLQLKDYKNAWICFHSRLERQEIKDQVHWFAPQWSGESISRKNILIYPEQGVGDNLVYSGCFAEAIADAKETHIVCDNRLKGLYQHNFPTAIIHSYADINKAQVIDADLDVQIFAGSLAYLYLLSEQAFLNQPPLSIPKPLQQAKASRLSDKKLKVGISWFHGRINDGNEHSMFLDELLPLLKNQNIEWVNLQFGEWQPEVSALEQKHGIKIVHFDDCCASDDFDHYGALIANLDLVISASNAALMFATRLGIKSWMFSPAPEMFLQRGEDIYDGKTIKKVDHFYRSNEESWQGVIEQMCDAIKALPDYPQS